MTSGSKPPLDAADRRERLNTARSALATNDPVALRWALERLPDTGEKALILRESLRAKLQRLAVPSAQAAHSAAVRFPTSESPPSDPLTRHRPSEAGRSEVRLRVGVVDNNRITFSVVETESPEMFSLRVLGGVIEVRVNRAHPASVSLLDADGLCPSAELLLAAWATLESEAGSERRQECIRDLRLDWSRAAKRIARRRTAE